MNRFSSPPRERPAPHESPCPRLMLLEGRVDERWRRLDRTLERLETSLDRLDRRLWLAAFTCAAGAVGALGALLLNSPSL